MNTRLREAEATLSMMRSAREILEANDPTLAAIVGAAFDGAAGKFPWAPVLDALRRFSQVLAAGRRHRTLGEYLMAEALIKFAFLNETAPMVRVANIDLIVEIGTSPAGRGEVAVGEKGWPKFYGIKRGAGGQRLAESSAARMIRRPFEKDSPLGKLVKIRRHKGPISDRRLLKAPTYDLSGLLVALAAAVRDAAVEE